MTETEHERAERDISPATRRFVLERDNLQCQVCGTTYDLHLHHWKTFRSQGGGHEPENLVTVCFKHHEAIHRHEIDVVVMEWRPGEWSAFVIGRFSGERR